jgi:hypothetical protein
LLALDERRLRVLENGERPDPLKPVFTTCPISGRTVTVAPTEMATLPPIDESTPRSRSAARFTTFVTAVIFISWKKN